MRRRTSAQGLTYPDALRLRLSGWTTSARCFLEK
jgi:hypothetical protein